MKKLLAIFIICSLVFQCVVHLGILGLYELRKDYIARNLCENINRPELNCCGKCYLRKQLKKADNSNDPSKESPAKAEKQEWVYFILPGPIRTPVFFAYADRHYYTAPAVSYRYDYSSDIFRPPAA